MSVRVRKRTTAASTPQEKLSWAEGRLVRLRASAADAMRALMTDLEDAATRLEFASEQPEMGDALTRFADRADAIDRLSLDILYTRQIAEELRASGFGPAPAAADAQPSIRAARASRPVAAAPIEPAPAGNAGVSQADIDALIRARAKAS